MCLRGVCEVFARCLRVVCEVMCVLFTFPEWSTASSAEKAPNVVHLAIDPEHQIVG